MNTNAEQTAIEAVLNAVRQGHHARDSGAIAAHFAPGAVIFDLAPPLAHGLDAPGLAAWLDSWAGPVDQTWRDLTISVSGDLAFCHGLCNVNTTANPEGDQVKWWQRTTMCLRRIGGEWKIVHEHSSVPFYMDGSYRAAIDLRP